MRSLNRPGFVDELAEEGAAVGGQQEGGFVVALPCGHGLQLERQRLQGDLLRRLRWLVTPCWRKRRRRSAKLFRTTPEFWLNGQLAWDLWQAMPSPRAKESRIKPVAS